MMQTKILFDEQPLVIAPSLAELVGLNESIILQQLHYWLNKSSKDIDGHTWIYNTYDDWKDQFPFWSISTIRRIISTLENSGIILTANYNQRKFDKTKWYSLDYEKLEQLEKSRGVNSASVQNEQTSCSEWTEELFNLNTPIPETTTETTTEITTTSSATVSEQRADAREKLIEVNPAKEDEGLAEVMTLYQDNIHPICGSIEADNLADLVTTYSARWVEAAIKESVKNSVRKLSYIIAILQRWRTSGIDEPWLNKKSEKGYDTASPSNKSFHPSAQVAWEEVHSKLIINKQKGIQWSNSPIEDAVKKVGYMNLMTHGASCMANFITQYNEVIRNGKFVK